MRQAAVALLAVPVLGAVYLGTALRRSILARAGLALGLALVLGIGVIGAGSPTFTAATPVSPILPLAQADFSTTFSTDRGLTDPVTIVFNEPMDERSVAGATRVEPAVPVDLAWDSAGTVLTISPRTRWAVATFQTVTVDAGALARSGQPLARPARAAFLTRTATIASVVATVPVGDRVSTATAFTVSFAGAVDRSTVADSIRLDPAVPGTVVWEVATGLATRYRFVPAVPLMPDVPYRLIVAGVRDPDGLTIAPTSLSVRTARAPAVLRFRPVAGAVTVARDASISVRFTEPMDRASTAGAFSVSVAGRAVAGTLRWAESDTVLVLTPSTAMPYGSLVSMEVAAGARSATGVALGIPAQGTFRTIASPAAPTPPPPPVIAVKPPTTSTGGGTTGGSWGSVETYYLGLMNCTRTGGWVTSTGACSSPGGRNVAPLRLDAGISTNVSRPYARKIAISGDCSHFIGGTPGDRLRRAGYTSYRWAENLGCGSGDARAAVLASHLFFQAEKSSLGGHYVNLMNALYDRVGIGVWVSSGRVRLVIDFYHP